MLKDKMLASIFGSEPEYLYLTLDHRFELPGYHWALVLSTKDSPDLDEDTSHAPDSYRWHLTNVPSTPRKADTRLVPWYKEQGEISMFASISLIARFTLAQFKASKHAATIRRINEVVDNVVIVQDDPNFRCRTWLKLVVEGLMRAEIIKLNLVDADLLESRAINEADNVMKGIAAGEIVIDRKSAIPTFDMRLHKK